MILIQDSREQSPLTFPVVKGVEVATKMLAVGDYGAIHGVGGRGVYDPAVVERKSLGDLFASFSGGYEAEKAKLQKAKTMGITYILAIEAPFLEVLKGHAFWKDGEVHESRKSGLAQIRQLMTWQRKYGVQVVYCESRRSMAVWILEYFLSFERITQDAAGDGESLADGGGH